MRCAAIWRQDLRQAVSRAEATRPEALDGCALGTAKVRSCSARRPRRGKRIAAIDEALAGALRGCDHADDVGGLRCSKRPDNYKGLEHAGRLPRLERFLRRRSRRLCGCEFQLE
jgi:hypothetical protein